METPNFDRITPQNCINAKVRRLHRVLDSIYQKRLKPFGLKGSMLSILFIVGKNTRIGQKAIADRLALDQSTISRDVKKLTNKGLISTHSGSDSRYSELALTTAGANLLEIVSPIWESTHKEVEELLGKYSIQQLDGISDAINSNKTNLGE